jgi:hypothetical protein
MSRTDERNRLPPEGGESHRPSWKIKGRQTCLCAHESLSPSALSPRHLI